MKSTAFHPTGSKQTTALFTLIALLALLFHQQAYGTDDSNFHKSTNSVAPSFDASTGRTTYFLSNENETQLGVLDGRTFTELYVRLEFPPSVTPALSDFHSIFYGNQWSRTEWPSSEFHVRISGQVMEIWHLFPHDASTTLTGLPRSFRFVGSSRLALVTLTSATVSASYHSGYADWNWRAVPPNRLSDAMNREATQTPIAAMSPPYPTPSGQKHIVLVHGWNRLALANPYALSQDKGVARDDWRTLLKNLVENPVVQQGGWEVSRYDWHEDASTGVIPLAALTARHAANSHGRLLGERLAQRNPTHVHFICHSAGSWLGRRAAAILAETNPSAVIQVTVLDPFVPTSEPYSGGNFDLTSDWVNKIGPDSLENYYVANEALLPPYQDVTDVISSTSGIYPSWTNLRVNAPLTPFYTEEFNHHGGPIKWYAVTAQTANLRDHAALSWKSGFVNSLAVRTSMTNDSFSSAQTMSGDSGQARWFTHQATMETGEPLAASTQDKTVWGKWTPSLSGQATISTQGTDFTNALGIYTGNSLGTLTKLASGTNSGVNPPPASATLEVTAGTTYYVQVGGYTPFDFGIAIVNWTVSGAPASPVALTHPTQGSFLTGNISVAATATGADTVEFYLNGALQLVSPAPYSWTWDTTTVPNGRHLVQAVAYSSGLEIGRTDVIEVQVQNTTGPIDSDEYEPNDRSTSATPLQPDTPINARISSPTDVDWYQTTLTGSGQINVQLSAPAGLDYDLELYGPDGRWVAGSYKDVGMEELINYATSVPGTYALRVYSYPIDARSFSTIHSYTINVSVNGSLKSARHAIVSWGGSQIPAQFYTSRLTQVSAGLYHNLGLKSDGTVVAWGTNSLPSAVPEDMKEVVQVSAGWYHSLALKHDGTVVQWGGAGWVDSTVPTGLNSVVQVAAGSQHSLALKNDGTVVSWGLEWSSTGTVPAGLTNVIQIGAGANHSLALKRDGSVVAWGGGLRNTVPSTLNGVVQIATGRNHSLALKSNGTVVAWGENNWYQCNVPTGLTDVVQIAAGGDHSLALKKDGTVVCWGKTLWGESMIPTDLGGIVQISAGPDSGAALRSDGSVVTWGSNLGVVDTSQFGVISQVAHSGDHCLVLRSDGTVVAWGHSRAGTTKIPAGLNGVVQVAAAGEQSYALKSDGTVIAWGIHPQGQPDIPPGLSGIFQISAGSYSALALRSDGSVVGLPSNSPPGSAVLTAVPQGLSRVVQIACSDYHALALKDDGTVVAWGYNGYGQATVPSNLSNVIEVAAGAMHSIALKSDGTVVAWGKNESGQTTIPYNLGNVVKIASGGSQNLALRGDGTVIGWGDNSYEQATIPSGIGEFSQIDVGGNTNVVLTALSSPEGPTEIVGQPRSAIVLKQQSALFSVSAVAGTEVTYQWRRNGVPISGATEATYSTPPMDMSDSGAIYTVVISDGVQSIISWPARLTVITGISPTITTDSPISIGSVSSNFTSTFSASGGVAPYAWEVISGVVPVGLTLNANGTLSGIPTVPGDYMFTVQVAGADGGVASKEFLLRINSTPLVVSSTTFSSGVVGKPYAPRSLVANGGVSPRTWALASGSSLPDGLSLSSEGVVSGTPTKAWGGTFTAQVTDAWGTMATQDFRLIIWQEVMSPMPSGVVGTAYARTLSVTSGVGPRTWSLAEGSVLPVGLTLSPAGVISGTPEASGIYSFTVEVVDVNGLTLAMDLTLSISAEATARLQGIAGASSVSPLGRIANGTVIAFPVDDFRTPPVVGTTNASGNFDLGVTAGRWELLVLPTNAATERNLTQSASSFGIEVAEGETRSGLLVRPFTISPSAFLTVSGRVVDANGDPVVGRFVRGLYGGYQTAAVTDSEGRYWMPYASSGWSGSVEVVIPGYLRQAVTGPTADFSPLPVTAHIVGRLTLDGNSISNATARAVLEGSTALQTEVITGEDGSYNLPVFGGTWTVHFRDIEVSSPVLSPQTWSSTVSLTDGQTLAVPDYDLKAATGAISGFVRNASGEIVGNASIQASSVINGVGFSTGTYSDSNGAYLLPVIDGAWTIQAFPPSGNDFFAPRTISVRGSATLDLLAWTPTVVIRGVVTQDGAPVSGVVVNAWGERSLSTTTDENGFYEIGISSGNWQLAVSGSGFYLSRVVISSDGDSLSGINFDLPGTVHSILGTVLDAMGTPLSANVTASATILGVNYSVYTNTTEGGQFSLPALEGDWRILANSPGNSFRSQSVSVSGTSVVSLSPPRVAAEIRGRVTKDGVPMADIEITAYLQQVDGYQVNAVTDSDGYFSLGVDTGRWSVSLGYIPDSMNILRPDTMVIDVGEGDTITGVDFPVLSATGTISGRIMDENGNPLAGRHVNATSNIGGTIYRVGAPSDGDGGYILPVVDGNWRVAVGAPGFLAQNVVVVGSAVFDLSPPPVTAHLTGRVLKDGVPTPGITVRANFFGDSGFVEKQSITNEGGEFNLGVFAGSWGISHSGEGLILPTDLSYATLSDGETLAVGDLLIFSPTATISGTVLDTNDLPRGLTEVWGLATVNGMELQTRTTTNAEGHFSLPVIPGVWNVSVSLAGYRTQQISVSGSTVADFRPYSATAVIRGRVLAAGLPISGANVFANEENGTAWCKDSTDSNGYFELGVFGGAWRVSFQSHLVYNMWVFSVLPVVELSDGQTVEGLTLSALAATGTISGRVDDALGNPVEQMPVEARGEKGGLIYTVVRTTGKDGRYELPVFDGEWVVQIIEEGQSEYSSQLVTVAGSVVANFSPQAASPNITTSTALAGASIGADFNQTLEATGGQAPYTWTLEPGSRLPAGLTLDTGGSISGMPLAAGSGNFTVRVTGTDGLSSTGNFSLVITSPQEAWMESSFSMTDHATGRTTWSADFDGDGLSNFLEYAFSTDPKSRTSAAQTLTASDSSLQLSFPCDTNRSDVTYTVQTSSTLAEHSWIDIAQSIGGRTTSSMHFSATVIDSGQGKRTVSVLVPVGGVERKKFLRVKATALPTPTPTPTSPDPLPADDL